MSLEEGNINNFRGANMTILILIRHGQSIWNAENRFTGWTNVELSEKGK